MSTPAFQFYASDFLTSTQSWDIHEVGIYIRLLSNQWVNLKLPKEIDRLARIAGCDSETFKKAWVILGFKFIEGSDGFLRNARLEAVRVQKDAYIEKQRLNGNKGGRPRKVYENKNPNETQTKPKNNPTANPNETTSTSKIDKSIYSDFIFFNNGFDGVWKDYLEMRVRIRKPATKKAEILALKDLSKLSKDNKDVAIEIVEQSIKNSWQGIFPLKEDNQKKTFNSWNGDNSSN